MRCSSSSGDGEDRPDVEALAPSSASPSVAGFVGFQKSIRLVRGRSTPCC